MGESYMMQFICYFFPAIIAVWITEIFDKKNFELKQILYHFCMYTILINAIIFLILILFFNPEPSYLSPVGFSYAFTLKYLGFSLVLSIIIPFIFKIIKNNINIDIDIEIEKKETKNGKENNKKKKNSSK